MKNVKKIWKRLTAVALAALMSVYLVGCGGGTGSGNSGGSDSSGGSAAIKVIAKSLTPNGEQTQSGYVTTTLTDVVMLNEDNTYVYITMNAMHPSWDINTIGFNSIEYQMGTYTTSLEDEYGIDAVLSAPTRVVKPSEYDSSGFVVTAMADSDTVDDATKASMLEGYSERTVSINMENLRFTVS